MIKKTRKPEIFKINKQTVDANKHDVYQYMVDQDALSVIKKLQSNKFEAYIVGGGIRDLLLKKIPKDYDIVTNATPERIRQIFAKNSTIIGRRFKIVHIYFQRLNERRTKKIGKPSYERHVIEVSTYRDNKMKNTPTNEHGRILVDNNYGSMDQDVFRRDFTINSLYYDPINEVIIDYHNGLSDLKNNLLKIIGHANERYQEDPVRVLRAIRLAVKLNLTIDDGTLINFFNAKYLLINEPKGRLLEEMIKILMSGASVKIVEELNELGLPKRVFTLFDKLFFNSKIDQFAQQALIKTDLRISTGEEVSLIFIFAGLIWQTINQDYIKFLNSGINSQQALADAITLNQNLILNSGITRNLYQAICEIWMLQLEFENPNILKFDNLLKNPRFRQAWHLFSLRNEFQQINQDTFNWWQRYMESENEVIKTNLLIELADLFPEPTKKNKKPRIRKKNKSL